MSKGGGKWSGQGRGNFVMIFLKSMEAKKGKLERLELYASVNFVDGLGYFSSD